jgi:hypothetical protein
LQFWTVNFNKSMLAEVLTEEMPDCALHPENGLIRCCLVEEISMRDNPELVISYPEINNPVVQTSFQKDTTVLRVVGLLTLGILGLGGRSIVGAIRVGGT